MAPIAIGGLMAALGLYELGTDELGTDESTSFFIATRDWADMWTSLSTSEANGSPFYLLLHFWTNLGDTEFVLRILPLMFAVATPVVLYFLVKRLFGTACGMGAGLVLTANAFFVAHSQNLRSYSMSAFFATLSTYLFVRIVEDKPGWAAPAYVASGTVLIYAHFFGAWVLIVHALSLLLLERARVPLRPLLLSYATIVVLTSPLAYFILFQDVGQVDWIPALSAYKVFAELEELVGFGGIIGLVAFGLALLGATALVARRPGDDEGRRARWATALFVMWFLIPVAGAFAISLAKPLWQARYLLVAVPGLAAATAVFLGSLRRPLYGIVGILTISAIGFAQLPEMYAFFYEPFWRARSAVVRNEGRPQDGLLFYSPTTIRTFGYHYGFYRGDIAHPEIIYPDKYWLGFSRTRFNPPIARIVRDAKEHDRVWMMLGAAKAAERKVEQRELIAALADACETVNREWRELGYLRFEGCDSGGTV